jgi:hypothetical protein
MMQTSLSATIARLAAALTRAGLAGADAHTTARESLIGLLRQPHDGHPTDHHAAHNTLVLFAVRAGYGRGLLDGASPAAARAVIARLVYAGATDAELDTVIAQREAA